jgi:hypothetical protein
LAVLKRSGVTFAFCVLSAVASLAQSSPNSSPSALQAPLRGFVPPYEILRTVRAAGFDPLAPPLREGTTYVVRAIDFRGVPMRVVVDARSGAIRDANRIIAGPGLYGPYVPGPYAPVSYGRRAMQPYPSDDIEAGYGHAPYAGMSELSTSDRHSFGLAPGLGFVPLPRPRPANVTATSAREKTPIAKPNIASAPAAPAPEVSSKPGGGSAIPAIND